MRDESLAIGRAMRDLLGAGLHVERACVDDAALVEAVRYVERAAGDARIRPTASEASSREAFRLSCVAVRDLPAGHRLDTADVAFRRPGGGLPPVAEPQLRGRTLKRALLAGTPIAPDDLA